MTPTNETCIEYAIFKFNSYYTPPIFVQSRHISENISNSGVPNGMFELDATALS